MVTLEEVNLNIEQLHRDIDEIRKEYKHILSVLNEIYADRDILTSIDSGHREIQKAVVRADTHNKQLSSEIKNTVEATGEEVISETENVRKIIPQKIVANIQTAFDKEKTTLKKKGWWIRLTNRFKHK